MGRGHQNAALSASGAVAPRRAAASERVGTIQPYRGVPLFELGEDVPPDVPTWGERGRRFYAFAVPSNYKDLNPTLVEALLRRLLVNREAHSFEEWSTLLFEEDGIGRLTARPGNGQGAHARGDKPIADQKMRELFWDITTRMNIPAGDTGSGIGLLQGREAAERSIKSLARRAAETEASREGVEQGLARLRVEGLEPRDLRPKTAPGFSETDIKRFFAAVEDGWRTSTELAQFLGGADAAATAEWMRGERVKVRELVQALRRQGAQISSHASGPNPGYHEAGPDEISAWLQREHRVADMRERAQNLSRAMRCWWPANREELAHRHAQLSQGRPLGPYEPSATVLRKRPGRAGKSLEDVQKPKIKKSTRRKKRAAAKRRRLAGAKPAAAAPSAPPW